MKRFLYLASVVSMMACHAALAQPDLNNAPKAENPMNRKAAAAQRAAEKKALRVDGAKVGNLQERNAKRLELRLERLPRVLIMLGITDTKTQESIVEHFRSALKSRESIAEAQQKLRRALSDKTLPDAHIKAVSNEPQTARKVYEAAFAKSLDELDKKIGYRKNMRLEAVLLSIGALDPYGADTVF
jgi:hypothetical protein